MVVYARHRATMVSKEDSIENRLELEKSGVCKAHLEIIEVVLKEILGRKRDEDKGLN